MLRKRLSEPYGSLSAYWLSISPSSPWLDFEDAGESLNRLAVVQFLMTQPMQSLPELTIVFLPAMI